MKAGTTAGGTRDGAPAAGDASAERRGLGETGTDSHGGEDADWEPWFLPADSGVSLRDLKRGLQLNNHLGSGDRHGSHAARASWAAWGRLRRKLEAGKPVLGVGIGSSVLGIHGGCSGPAPQFASMCAFCCRPRVSGNPNTTTGSVARFGRGWARVGVDFLRHRYGSDVAFYNYARPGGTAALFNHCLSKWAPAAATADFAVLEFNVVAQDATAEDGRAEVREVEGVLRQLLAAPRPPALLLVNFFSWCRDVPALCAAPAASPAALADLSPLFTGTGRSDGRLQELAAHYALPVASALHAFWPLYFPGVDPAAAAAAAPSGLTTPPPFLRLPPAHSDPPAAAAHLADGIHPTTAGNLLFGPWFTHALHAAISSAPAPAAASPAAATDTHPPAPLRWQQLPPPLYGPRYAQPPQRACFTFAGVGLTGGAAPSNITLAARSSLPDRAQMATSTFFAALPNRAFAQPPEVLSSSGFEYVEMVPAADGSLRWKPGLEAAAPGAYVDIAYRTEARGGALIGEVHRDTPPPAAPCTTSCSLPMYPLIGSQPTARR